MKPTFIKTQPSRDYEQQDIDNAIVLRDALQKNIAVVAKVSIFNWAHSFAILRRTAKAPDRLVSVLAWYTQNIGRPYVPMVRSADGFRKKYDAIEKAANRSGTSFDSVLISECAKRIVAEANDLFVVSEIESLPIYVQQSLDTYATIKDRIYSHYKKQVLTHVGDIHSTFLYKLLTEGPLSATPEEYVSEWIKQRLQRYARRPRDTFVFRLQAGDRFLMADIEVYASAYGYYLDQKWRTLLTDITDESQACGQSG